MPEKGGALALQSASQTNSTRHYTRYYEDQYGDLVYDLAEEILGPSPKTQLVLRAVLKKLVASKDLHKNTPHERSWVLRVTCDALVRAAHQSGTRMLAEDQIKLDAGTDVSARLSQFGIYFQRLRVEDQLLLLLRDKHQLPYSEIAVALKTPEGSLKTCRQQALRTLEDWLWNSK